MHPLSAFNRDNILNKIVKTNYDLIVIGGGITGAGIALDAVLRGLKVLLVEKQDFAGGTSSRSTKLIHGGLRYLKQFEFAQVAGVGKERKVLHLNAPHLVLPEKMLLPIYYQGAYGKFLTSLGLWIYDFLAGVKPSERKKMLSRKQTIKVEPLLNKEKLLGSGLYTEYRTDDARLTIEIIKSASLNGADCLNYVEVSSFIYDNDKLAGVNVLDHSSGVNYPVKASYVINAAGPWVDKIRAKESKLVGKQLRLTKGVHLVVSQKNFPLNNSVYFDSKDGRMIFAIPRDGKTYFGTTDTDFNGSYEEPEIDMRDAQYLLKSINENFPQINLSIKDVEAAWAGLRPLIHEEGKPPSQISRKEEIFYSKSGLISIAGGKLTGYRKMAEKVVDVVVGNIKRSRGISFGKCQTKTFRLEGAQEITSETLGKYIRMIDSKIRDYNLGLNDASYLVSHYGANTLKVLGYFNKSTNATANCELVIAELKYCIDNEALFHLDDFLIRRTSRLLFGRTMINQILPNLLIEFASIFNLDQTAIELENQRILNALKAYSVQQ